MDSNPQPAKTPPYGLPLPGMERRTVVTWVLIAITVVVWAAMELSGGSEDREVLLRFGAMYGPLIANGQPWRLFTAMFLHVGYLHLLLNGIGLLIFGRLTERIFGHYRFTTIYILAGLSGSVASYTINRAVIGVGASGAIFGVLGALAAFFLLRRDILGSVGRQYLTSLTLIAAINLFLGYIMPGIDNWAHLGGLGGGFVLGLALAPIYRREGLGEVIARPSEAPGRGFMASRAWVVVVVLVVLVGWTWLVSSNPSIEAQALTHVLRAERLYDEEQYGEGIVEATEAIELDPAGPAFFIRGKLYASIGDSGLAASDLRRAWNLPLDERSHAEVVEMLVSIRR